MFSSIASWRDIKQTESTQKSKVFTDAQDDFIFDSSELSTDEHDPPFMSGANSTQNHNHVSGVQTEFTHRKRQSLFSLNDQDFDDEFESIIKASSSAE